MRWTIRLITLSMVLWAPGIAAAADCNGNGIDDAIDIAGGFSEDCNLNGIPDTCDLTPALVLGAPVPHSVDSSPASVVSGDLDGINGLDVVTANNGAATVSVLLNTGGGTFATAVQYPIDTKAFAVTIADVNGDGDPDLAAATKNDTVSVLLNNGDGTFADGGFFLTLGDRPLAIASGDLDGINGPDLAVANRDSLTVSVLLNLGDGTFASAVNYPVGDTSRSVVIGDFDAVNGLDLAVANKQSDTVSVLLNNGDGTFPVTMNVFAGNGPVSLAAGDLDGDLDLDLAVVNSGSDRLTVLRNAGNGQFVFAGSPLVGHAPEAVTLVDLDGDGDRDAAVANYGTLTLPGSTVSVLLNDGTGLFAAQTSFPAGSFPISLTAGDVDGDTNNDLVVANDLANGTVSVLFGQVTQSSQDCNGNGRPDECDIALGQQGAAPATAARAPVTAALAPVAPAPVAAAPAAAPAAVAGPGGIVFLSGDDADDFGHCQGTACGGLYPSVFSFVISHSTSPGSGILAIGVNAGINGSNALTALNSWNDIANGGPGAVITILIDPVNITTVDFAAFDMIYIPSISGHTLGGITPAQLDALNTRQLDLVNFVDVLGGGVVALTEANVPNAYGWLPIPIETADQLHASVCPTPALTDALAPAATCANMSHGFYHTIFTGPPGFLGLPPLALSADDPVDQVVLLGGVDVIIGGQIKLTPDRETHPVGGRHTVNATVVEGTAPFGPIAGAQVTFGVISGPNPGNSGTAITDVNGQATFTYTGDGPEGTDEIRATFDDAAGTHFSNIVTARWLIASQDCNTNDIPDECEPDADADGVPDDCDLCPGTPPGLLVDPTGCLPSHVPALSERGLLAAAVLFLAAGVILCTRRRRALFLPELE